jgi:hypothetical protein
MAVSDISWSGRPSRHLHLSLQSELWRIRLQPMRALLPHHLSHPVEKSNRRHPNPYSSPFHRLIQTG